MNEGQWMPLLGGLALGGAVVGGGLWAWLSGQLRQERQRGAHGEQARQLSAQQLTQARKQIEQLQRENHELRLAVRPAPRPAPAVEAPAVDAAEAARLYAESKMQPPPPKEAAKAFKDTVVLRRNPESTLD